MSEIAENPKCAKEASNSPRFVIGIRISGQEKSELFDPHNLNLRVGTWVMVNTKQGDKLGIVSSNKIFNFRKDNQKPHGKVLRLATDKDFVTVKKRESFEKRGTQFCLQQIGRLNLPMNLSRVVYLRELNKTIFYFTAEGRVDFRELVRMLAHNLKTRIEMKQVGVRDEAKAITGFGVCGEPLCCSTFLDVFTPVTIRMAKDQGLALNPSKISGVCGRLMCCLQYEHEIYKELVKNIPKYGSTIETPDGPGKVLKNNILDQMVSVLLEDESIMNYPLRDIRKYSRPDKQKNKVETKQENFHQSNQENNRKDSSS